MTSTNQFQETDPQLDAVLADLRGGAARRVRSPGTAAVRRTVHRRRIAQRSIAGAAALAIIAGVATAALAHRAPTDQIVPAVPTATAPAPTPSEQAPSPDPQPSGGISAATGPGIETTDWRNAKVTLPQVGACPARTVTFKNGASGSVGADYRWTIFGPAAGTFRHVRPVYADVLGDQAREALVEVDCSQNGWEPDPSLVAFRAAGNGTLVGAKVTGAGADVGQWLHSVAVKGKVVIVEVDGTHPVTNALRTTIRRMTWDGSRFVRADPKLAILDADRRKTVYTLPAQGDCPAYSGPLPKRGTGSGLSRDLSLPTAMITGPVGDLDGDGIGEQLWIAQCILPSTGMSSGRTQEVVVALTLRNGRAVTLGTMAGAQVIHGSPEITGLTIAGGIAKVTYSTGNKASYRWNGSAFVPA